MDLEFFKKEVGKIKQTKLTEEEKAKKEYEDIYTQTFTGILDLIEKLLPYIEHAAGELKLEERCKIIEYSIPYACTVSIRWFKDLAKAVFYYTGHGEQIMFTLDDFANQKFKLNIEKLQWIKDALNPEVSRYFVKDLLQRLESGEIYSEQLRG